MRNFVIIWAFKWTKISNNNFEILCTWSEWSQWIWENNLSLNNWCNMPTNRGTTARSNDATVFQKSTFPKMMNKDFSESQLESKNPEHIRNEKNRIIHISNKVWKARERERESGIKEPFSIYRFAYLSCQPESFLDLLILNQYSKCTKSIVQSY